MNIHLWRLCTRTRAHRHSRHSCSLGVHHSHDIHIRRRAGAQAQDPPAQQYGLQCHSTHSDTLCDRAWPSASSSRFCPQTECWQWLRLPSLPLLLLLIANTCIRPPPDLWERRKTPCGTTGVPGRPQFQHAETFPARRKGNWKRTQKRVREPGGVSGDTESIRRSKV